MRGAGLPLDTQEAVRENTGWMDTFFPVRQALSTNVPDQQSWLEAARLGEPWALEQFFHAYQAPVYALCHRILGRSEDAQDATQTTFILAFRELARFRGDSPIKHWLYRIAVNEALGLRRRRREGLELVEESASVPDAAPTVVEQLAVRAALARTKPLHRVVLVLRFWEELSYAEIADLLGISLDAVKIRLHRAKEEFRKWYEDER
jgi:RNA polymerase sigma-70 factor, ECF subfamily